MDTFGDVSAPAALLSGTSSLFLIPAHTWAPEGASSPPGATGSGAAPPGDEAASRPLFVSFSVLLDANIPKINLGWLVSNLADISLRAYLKPKTAENRNWHCGILLIG